MAKDLTVLSIDKAAAGSSRKEIADGHTRGLYLVVQPSGRKSWAFRYRRTDGSPAKLTIGGYPEIDLPKARALANQARTAVAEGTDPAAEKRSKRQKARKPPAHELTENAIARFIERHAKVNTREASWKEAQRILKKEIEARYQGKPLAVITKADILVILDEIVDRGSPISANRSLAVIRRFFNWAVEKDLIEASPCDRVRPPTKPRSRDRVLTDEELERVWKAADHMGWPFGPLVQLLILTGQRRDEVGGMTWGELDLEKKTWLLPRGRVKNAKGHEVPLSSEAVAILKSVPHIKSKKDLVFTTTGDSPVSGFTKAKSRLDELVGAALAQNDPMLSWVLHDLRRTMASGCARLGVAPQVVEAILNHKSGTIRGVAAIYNRYDHAAEKRSAINLWAEHVARLAGRQTVCQRTVDNPGI